MEIRQLNASEIKQAIKLSDSIFRETGHTSMGEAFPQVFTKGVIHSFGAFDGEKLVSFIGLVPATIKVGPARLQVFSLGSVCTGVAYRGQGISTKMLQAVYEYIDKAGASILFVSGDRGMYLRNHCYHFGGLKEYLITKDILTDISYKGTIRHGENRDVFALDQLRNKTEIRFESSVWEWSRLLNAGGLASITKKYQALYVAENDGALDGYVVISVNNDGGKTGQSFVTEWGGNPEVIHAILAEILKDEEIAEIVFHVPWYEQFDDQLKAYFTQTMPHSGTVHLINEQRFLKQIQVYLNEKSTEKLSITKQAENSFLLALGNDSVTLTQEALIAWLFMPETEVTQTALKTILPIPLPNPEGMYFV